MNALIYHLYLEQPVLVTSLVGDPNSMVTYAYLPGSTLRGLFVQRYLQRQRQASGAGDATFQRLFLSGAVRYLHAYPMTRAGVRTLPTPRALQQAKDETGPRFVVTLASARPTEATAPAKPGASVARREGRWIPVKRPFCALAADELLLLEPERTLAIHVQRDRVKGRAWIERKEMDATETPAGTVFRYEALEAGQWFAGVVVCDAAADAQAIAQLLASSDTAWLGRSRSATYGKVRLQVEGVKNDWSETPALPQPPARQQTLTLLSDTLLRDAEGNLVELLDDATLAAYLGAEVRLDPARTVLHTTMVGGFNRTWQLPVNQERALAAGSVIGFTLEAGTLDRAALEWAGIGERRSEGYGRLVFNWLDAPTYQAVEVEGKRSPAQSAAPETGQGATLNLPPTDQALAATMTRRLFEREVDQAIIAFVQRHVWPSIDAETDAPGLLPSNSQLARLRVLVRRAQATGDTAMVAREFAGFRPFARTGYERAHLAHRTETLAAWIERLLQEPARVWPELGAVKQIAVAAVSVEPTEAQARAATLRLLAAVLVAPVQRRKTLRTTPTEVTHG